MLKSWLSKINFELGRNPTIQLHNERERFIPKGFRAVLLITADFELAWAWRYSKSNSKPYELTLRKARQERKNFPSLISLFDEYQIPVTWATVGHLFLESCTRENGLAHVNMLRPDHFDNEFWRFRGKDWYEYDPCGNHRETPEWYAPDLITSIINSSVKHEIGCHTFSHIDCRDSVCSPELFEQEVNLCIKLAIERGIKLKTFVHPGHTIGNLISLKKLGFASYQTDYGNSLALPIDRGEGLWELKRTMEFAFREEWNSRYHIYRYKKIIDRAISSNTVCNFWFHPSFDERFLFEVLPSVLNYASELKNDVAIMTCGEYTDFLYRHA